MFQYSNIKYNSVLGNGVSNDSKIQDVCDMSYLKCKA